MEFSCKKCRTVFYNDDDFNIHLHYDECESTKESIAPNASFSSATSPTLLIDAPISRPALKTELSSSGANKYKMFTNLIVLTHESGTELTISVYFNFYRF
jgi:hypothetical protein